MVETAIHPPVKTGGLLAVKFIKMKQSGKEYKALIKFLKILKRFLNEMI